MENENPYIEVAVPLPVFNTYTYSLPQPLKTVAQSGMRGHRAFWPPESYRLYPWRLKRRRYCQYQAGYRPLDDFPIFPASMIPLFRWMADYYLHPRR